MDFKTLLSIAACAAVLPLGAAGVFEPDRFTFLNVAPFSPGSEDLLAKEMVEYRDRTGNDVVLYCLTLNPEGFPAMKKAEYLVGSYRRFKAKLEGSGIRLGVLIQATLGHWPRTDRNEEAWARSITVDDRTKRFCPDDPGCRGYLEDVATLLAKEKPCFILWDDDVHASGAFGAECFCDRHVAKFNAENGTKFTRAELQRAVKDCKPGDRICKAFEKLQRAFVNDCVDAMRAAIDRVDPKIPGGACMPYREHRYAGVTAEHCAAKGQPVVLRIDNSVYMHRTMAGYADNAAYTQAICDYWKGIPYLLDESDTWPHNRWSTSAAQLDLKLKCGIFNGLRGSKLWFVNAHKRSFPVSRGYTDVMAENREVYSALVAAVNGTTLTGLWAPSVGGRREWHPSWQSEAFAPQRSWITGMAGEFGVPFVCRRSRLLPDEICILSDPATVEVLSDAELKEIFSHRVLVDGAAAIALTKRGLAAYAGVKAEAGEGVSPLYNSERSADGKTSYAFSKHPETPLLTPLADGAETLTQLCYAPFGGSPDVEAVAPGAVYAKNALGGEVVTTAFYGAGFSWDPAFGEGRRDWFLKLLAKLGWNGYCVLNDQSALALQRVAADKSTLLAVHNLSFDPMKTVRLRTPAVPASVKALGRDGRWNAVLFKPFEGGVELAVKLDCCGSAAFRIAY